MADLTTVGATNEDKDMQPGGISKSIMIGEVEDVTQEETNPTISSIFKKKIKTTPCMRDSLIYGINGGIVVGLLTFLFTSRAQFACHCAFGSYMSIGMSYFCGCRYYRSTQDPFTDVKLE